jgi:hypothetical protein
MEERTDRMQKYLEDQRRKKAEQSLARKLEKQRKISAAREQAEAAIQLQRQMFAEREHSNLKKLNQFEREREVQRQRARSQAEQKQHKLKAILEESQRIEQHKKD